VTATTQEQERTAISDVALDYFEGWFSGDAERMRRALHPELAKRRLLDDEEGLDETTAPEMIEATAAGAGLRHGDPGKIEVEIVEVYGQIATAIVRSSVYREYLHLAQTRRGWKIVNAIWAWT